MAHWDQELDELVRGVQNLVDQAISSSDYRKLNQTVRAAVGRAVDLGSEAVRIAVDGVEKSVRSTQRPPKVVEAEIVQKKDLPALYAKTGNITAKGLVKAIGGGVMLSSSGLFSLAALVLILSGGSAVPALLTLGGIGAGAGLLASGVRNLNQVSRFKHYQKTLGQKTYCSLETLARGAGKSVDFVRKEVQKMIDKGYFRQGHLDQERTMLITSDETYHYYEQSRLKLEASKQQEAEMLRREQENAPNAQVREVLEKGDAFLAEIRRCNDVIPGQEVSEKMFRMEQIVERIFRRAKEHPEIVPDLKKLMDYYLPMTIKLLNAYADMDAQPVQGQTIQASKKEIEQTLDTLNFAFEKLLDDLFQDTALDVSSDITVLKTLLAQEGLAEDELKRMKNSTPNI